MKLWSVFRKLALPATPQTDALYFVADADDGALCDAYVSGDTGNVRKVKGAEIRFADSSLASDVALTSSNTWYDGPSVALAAGTWLMNITGHYRRNATVACNVAVRAFDGVSAHAHGEGYHPSANGAEMQVSSFGIAVLTEAKTVKLQMLVSTGNAAALMKAATQSNGQGAIATRITAIRLV